MSILMIGLLKNLYSILIVTVVLFSSCTNKDPEAFAKDIFTMVQQGDSLGVLNASISVKEYAEVVRNSTYSKEEKMSTENYYGELASEYKRMLAEDYAEVTSFAKQENIILREAKIDSIRCDKKVMKNVNEMLFAVYFHTNNGIYKLGCSLCFYTSSGWKLYNELYLKKVDA